MGKWGGLLMNDILITNVNNLIAVNRRNLLEADKNCKHFHDLGDLEIYEFWVGKREVYMEIRRDLKKLKDKK